MGAEAGGRVVRDHLRVDPWRAIARWSLLLSLISAVLMPLHAQADTGGLRRVGVLPWATKDAPNPVAVDSVARRMYGYSAKDNKIVEYNLTPSVPTVRRVSEVLVPPVTLAAGKARWALDSTHHRLYYLDLGFPPECLCPFIRVFDLQTLKVQASYNLGILMPHVAPAGLTYSAADHLVYLTGAVIGDPTNGAVGTLVPYYPLAMGAFDPERGSAVWSKVIPQCLHPMSSFPGGAIIARSRYQNALYTGCVRADAFGANVNFPGESGLVRVWFNPHADLAEAATFPVEYFPISGSYSGGEGVTGLSDYDPEADRFYMLSQSTLTPGVWAFDGRGSAWVGFVAADDEHTSHLGVDPRSGHLFVDSGEAGNDPARGLIVADGRATPISQGRVFPFTFYNKGVVILTDPSTGRLFLPVKGVKPGHQTDILVVADQTPTSPPETPDDHDTLTTDVSEGANTEATYSGSLNGFGSRVALVGGTGGITTSTGYTLNEQSVPLDPTPPVPMIWDHGYVLGLPPGDRGVFLGHVGLIDVRNSGASASAQAITPDSTTSNDYTNKQREVYKQLGASDDNVRPWLWPAAVCADGEGKPTSPDTSSTGTVAKASCDLKNVKADARAAAGEFVVGDAVSIGSSSFDGSSVRTAGEGIVTTAKALARDIRIVIPGAGTLTIGRITATARTVAHGRRGTARVQWSRDVEHLAVVDPSGNSVFSCAKDCDTSAIEAALREWAGAKIAIKFPTPRTRATPGGAFAEVQKNDAAYYDGLVVNNDETYSSPAAEILLYNDYGERSRLLIQLAAIQASSIYGISVLPSDSGLVPDLPPLPPPVADLVGPVSPPPPPPVYTAPPAQGGSLLERLVSTSRFLIRSPGDALMIGLIATLLLGAVTASLRRRSLLGLLDDFGTTSVEMPAGSVRSPSRRTIQP